MDEDLRYRIVNGTFAVASNLFLLQRWIQLRLIYDGALNQTTSTSFPMDTPQCLIT